MKDLPAPGATLREVLPGTPEDLDELATRLESYVDGAAAASHGLRQLDSGSWVGEAADAFWSSVGDILKKLGRAASAFQEASFALRTYTGVLREAQADIGRALTLIDQADRESRIRSATNADAIIQNVTAPYTGTVVPISSDDPGEPLRRQAETVITEAKSRVVAAARHAAEQLHTAAEHAPDKPAFWSRATHVVSEVAGGAVEATTGMATFAFKLTPVYELIDPDGYVENAVGLVKGLAYGAAHPVDFAKGVLDWDTWANSPGRALGHLLPAVALAVASAGAGVGAEVGAAGEAGAAAAVESAEARAGVQALEASGAMSRDLIALAPEDSWGNPTTLLRHLRDHGADFGSTSGDEYARQASEFLQRALKEGLQTKIDPDGVIRIYDPATNTFGAYNPAGGTRTFFKPKSPTYWDRQPGRPPWLR